MASQISLKVGNVTATLPIGAGVSDAQVAAALTRYARNLGIPTDGTPTEQLTAILGHFVDTIKRTSKRVQADELRALNEAAIQQQIDQENNL